MPFGNVHGAAYAAILIAAAIEGEVVFVAAAALVSQGRLNPVGVIIAGAIGAALGDQFYFYVVRGGLGWLRRYRAIESRGAALARRVRRHEALTIVAIRFSPGLRIALAAACAFAGVAPLKFSTLNIVASFAWATTLLFVVARFGPSLLTRLGLSGWWTILIPAVLVVLLFRWLGRHETKTIETEAATNDS
jgi:membrane protein DedA with SNARE-associated domain